MKKIIYLAIFLLFGPESMAQNKAIPASTQSYFDLAAGAGNQVYSGALSYNRTHGLLESKKLRLGYGLRFSAFSGNQLNYITAPAKLTKEAATTDTLNIKSPLSMGISATVNIEYLLSPKLRLGFNIDVVGLGFGSAQNSEFVSDENVAAKYPTSVNATPTSLNLLLVGDNDIGQLKSEFYIGYSLSEKLLLRAGLDMTFSEYTTAQILAQNNDRFRYKAMLFFAGVSFNPFK